MGRVYLLIVNYKHSSKEGTCPILKIADSVITSLWKRTTTILSPSKLDLRPDLWILASRSLASWFACSLSWPLGYKHCIHHPTRRYPIQPILSTYSTTVLHPYLTCYLHSSFCIDKSNKGALARLCQDLLKSGVDRAIRGMTHFWSLQAPSRVV